MPKYHQRSLLFLRGVYSPCHLKPLRAKGWEKALLEFTAATLADSASESKPASARLNEISCPGNKPNQSI